MSVPAPVGSAYSRRPPRSLRFVRRSGRDSHRRGQSLVEFALVLPILLLVLAAAADFGRVYFAYVAIENAAKEGALYGSRAPLCDDAAGGTACGDPNNVVARVQKDLKTQGIRDNAGLELVPSIQCLDQSNGIAHANMKDCVEGDTYAVTVSHTFPLLTPILSSIIGDRVLTSTSQAVVLNLAFDPTPGASIQKFVSPTGAVNSAEVIANCLEPDDTDANGFYRSPCRDSSTADPSDTVQLRFEQGATVAYRLIVGNSGAQTLTSVTVTDSTGSTGCAYPSTMPVGYAAAPCNYTRTAPNVSGVPNSEPFINIATIDSAQTSPAVSDVTVTVERPPARLQVLKWVSPFKEGNDGDGISSFGTVDDVSITYSTQVASPSVWFKIIVRNTGGQTATGVSITDSRGAIPFGQNNANAVCSAAPATLAASAMWECRYRVAFSSASPATTNNTAGATATNVTPDGDDTHTAIVRVAGCTGANRTVPNLIGLTKANAQTGWTGAGFTGALTAWNNPPNPNAVLTQNRQAFSCAAATSTMTVTRTTTP